MLDSIEKLMKLTKQEIKNLIELRVEQLSLQHKNWTQSACYKEAFAELWAVFWPEKNWVDLTPEEQKAMEQIRNKLEEIWQELMGGPL